jgi:hypothetical protein
MDANGGDGRRIEFISDEARDAHDAIVTHYRREAKKARLWMGAMSVVLACTFGFIGWVMFGEREEPHPACPNQNELAQNRPNRFDIIFRKVRLGMVYDEERRVIDCVWAGESELGAVVRSRHSAK